MLRTSVEEVPNLETLLCPICGFYYVHPLSVRVATGNFTVIVDSKGCWVVEAAKSEDSKAALKNRGARIILEYVCEYGHHGELIFQFHEGVTYVEHKALKPAREWRALWRD